MRRALRLHLFVSIGLLLAAAGGDSMLAQCPFPPPAPAPPPPVCAVDDLAFGAPTVFGWAPPMAACGPVLYDTVVGDLAMAWATKSVGASAPACLPAEDDAAGPAAGDAVIPPVGSGFWYLSRAATPGPDFTWNENEVGPANAYDRDVLLAGICPL